MKSQRQRYRVIADQDLETRVLSGILQGGPDMWQDIQKSGLRPDDFYVPRHDTIATLAFDCYAEGITGDWSVIANRLPNSDRANLRDLIVTYAAAPYPSLFDQACRRLVHIANARRLIDTFRTRAEEIAVSPLGEFDSVQMTGWLREELDQSYWNRSLGIMSAEEVFRSAEETHRAFSNAHDTPTPPTGHQSFDDICKLSPGNLVVIAGLPGSGKTTLSLEWMAAHSRAGKRAFLLSFEEGTREIWQRWMRRTDVSVGERLWRNWPLDRLEGYNQARELAIDTSRQVYFWEPGRGQKLRELSDLLSLIAYARQSKRVDVVYVDNVTSIANLGLSQGKQFERISEATQRLKNLAKELGIVIVLLAHVHRETARTSKDRPKLHNLFGSSALEQICDIGIIVDRTCKRDEEADPREVWVHTDKVRGPHNPHYKLWLDEESCTLKETPPEEGVKENGYWRR